MFPGAAHLKKLRRAEGDAKIFGVFRVKNHDFTPKKHIFSNFRGAPPLPPPMDPPLVTMTLGRGAFPLQQEDIVFIWKDKICL